MVQVPFGKRIGGIKIAEPQKILSRVSDFNVVISNKAKIETRQFIHNYT